MTMSTDPTTDRQSRRILGHLRERQEDMVHVLMRLAEAESPSVVPESQQQVQQILTESLQGIGFEVRHFRGRSSGGNLLATPASRRRGQPIQLLVGHCDTVWPLGTVSHMPVCREEGRLFGPGVFDMKGGLVQMLYALGALRELELEPAVAPVVFINSDEEIGSGESTHHIRRLARIADRAF
ncbi:MAG: M20/M25/M40 family metallo-hydrolase, partial [Planctomycetota bacterium]